MPSIVAADALRECVGWVKRQSRDTEVLVVQNGMAVGDVCRELMDYEGVTIYEPQFNLGCSASWNYACNWAFSKGYDRIFLMNDDFILTDVQALERMETYIDEYPDMVCHYHGFSGVAIKREHWELAGGFDEGFWPAYFEDNDFMSNVHQYGIYDKLFDVDKFTHYGSLSLKMSPQLNMLNMRTFDMNKQRYLNKWGGLPHQETYTAPWNGGEPNYPNVREAMKESGWEMWYF